MKETFELIFQIIGVAVGAFIFGYKFCGFLLSELPFEKRCKQCSDKHNSFEKDQKNKISQLKSEVWDLEREVENINIKNDKLKKEIDSLEIQYQKLNPPKTTDNDNNNS